MGFELLFGDSFQFNQDFLSRETFKFLGHVEYKEDIKAVLVKHK